MRFVFILLLAIHGFIHFFGAAKGLGISEMKDLKLPVSKTAGLAWLTCGILFALVIIMLLFHWPYWWIVALLALLLSQILIFLFWSDAKWGSIANFIFLLPVISSFLYFSETSYNGQFRSTVKEAMKLKGDTSLLTLQDMDQLPHAVQKYLLYTGCLNKPKTSNVRAIFQGEIKQSPDAHWMDFHSDQVNFFPNGYRYLYIESSQWGIPYLGLHSFDDHGATMNICIASLLDFADASGEKMDQSETVTLFNDMCVLAPATLIDPTIKWEEVETNKVKAHFTKGRHRISAILEFNPKGELILFSSDDRSMTTDGNTYESHTWVTLLRNYINLNGRHIASYGEAIWKLPDGDFCYGHFNLKKYTCNNSSFKERVFQ